MGYIRTRKVQSYNFSVKFLINTYSHYKKSIGGVVVYDITKRSSFENAEKWVNDLKANADPNIVIMLVGNKLDLCKENPDLRQVKYEEAKKFAKRHELLFKESSAFEDINVKETFEDLLQGRVKV